MTKARIRKRLPLEQAHAVQVDPNARYEAKRKDQGMKRTTFWAPVQTVPLLLEAAKRCRDEFCGSEFAEELEKFLHARAVRND